MKTVKWWTTRFKLPDLSTKWWKTNGWVVKQDKVL
jgi:hypothetical protein